MKIEHAKNILFQFEFGSIEFGSIVRTFGSSMAAVLWKKHFTKALDSGLQGVKILIRLHWISVSFNSIDFVSIRFNRFQFGSIRFRCCPVVLVEIALLPPTSQSKHEIPPSCTACKLPDHRWPRRCLGNSAYQAAPEFDHVRFRFNSIRSSSVRFDSIDFSSVPFD